MLPFHRPPLGAVLRLSPVAALAACWLALAVSRGPGFWAAPGPDREDDPAGPDSQAPDDLCREITRRLSEKDRLAGEVIEGRLSLVEAAARYRDLDAQPPTFRWRELREVYPGASDDECHCRTVIGNVRARLLYRPGGDPALVGRLETELQDLLRRGDFRLLGPDTPPAGGRRAGR
jgi:hypothetical protein